MNQSILKQPVVPAENPNIVSLFRPLPNYQISSQTRTVLYASNVRNRLNQTQDLPQSKRSRELRNMVEDNRKRQLFGNFGKKIGQILRSISEENRRREQGRFGAAISGNPAQTKRLAPILCSNPHEHCQTSVHSLDCSAEYSFSLPKVAGCILAGRPADAHSGDACLHQKINDWIESPFIASPVRFERSRKRCIDA